MRFIKPVPELLIPGKWKKSHSTQACVDISAKTYQAPLDEAPSSEDIRNHEYNHIAFSEPKEVVDTMLETAIGKLSSPFTNPEYRGMKGYADMAVRAIEDARVNWLGTKAGVSTARCTQADMPDKILAMIRTGKIPTKDLAMLYISADGYAPCEMLNVITEQLMKDKEVYNKLQEIINTVHTNAEDINKGLIDPTIELAKFFYKSLPPQPEGNGKDSGEKGKGDGKEGTSSGSGSGKEEPTGGNGKGDSKKKDITKEKTSESIAQEIAKTIQEDADKDRRLDKTRSENYTENTELTLTVIAKQSVMVRQDLDERLGPALMIGPLYPPLKFARKQIRVSPKKVPSHTGAYIRYVHRLAGDKKIFSDIKKFDIGTILIDCSGSMDFNEDDIMHIMKYCSGATIAVYSGSGYGTQLAKDKMKEMGINWGHDKKNYELGYLNIVAKDGKILNDANGNDLFTIRSCSGGGNMVDLPALQWLVKQRGRKFWVSDGIITGVRECQTRAMSMEATRLKKLFKIKQIYSIREMRELVESKNFKKYKDPWPNSILPRCTSDSYTDRLR